MSSKATAPEPRIGQAPPPELFQELLTRARTVTYMVRMDEPTGTLVYMSPRCEELLGITPEIFLGETQEERLRRIHPDDHEKLAAAIEAGTLTGRFDGRYRYLHPDGRVLHLLTLSRLVSESPGVPAMRMGLVMDLTAEMETSQALRDSETRYRALVEQRTGLVFTP